MGFKMLARFSTVKALEGLISMDDRLGFGCSVYLLTSACVNTSSRDSPESLFESSVHLSTSRGEAFVSSFISLVDSCGVCMLFEVLSA